MDQNAGTAQGGSDDDLEAIYRALRTGGGRDRVSDANVDALIALAHERGDDQLEYLLREWRSPCGEDAAAVPLDGVRGLPPAGRGSR